MGMLEVLRVLGEALRLDPGLFAVIDDDPAVLLLPALGVAAIAGVSTMLGHIAVLLLNRVVGLRLVSSLVVSALLLALLQVLHVAVTWTVASIALRQPIPFVPLIVVGLLSTAPLAFNFVTAMPHLGLGVGRCLEVWSYVIIVAGFAHAFGTSLPLALAFTIVGWLAMQLASRLLRRPVDWVGSKLWTIATGRPTMVTSRDILSGMPIIPVSRRSSDGEAAR